MTRKKPANGARAARGSARRVPMREFSRSLPMSLLRAREAVMRQFRPALRRHDLTEQQWRILRALAAIDAIEPMLAERERICGSRAQIDLVEFTLLKAYLAAGRLDDVRRLLQSRRPGPRGIPVAGMDVVV